MPMAVSKLLISMILAVQHILGHQHIETTLRNARLYDCTVAKDYKRAMNGVEG